MATPRSAELSPATGYILPANVGPNATAPFQREQSRTNVAGLLLWCVLLLAVFGGLFVRFGQAPTCAQAEGAIHAHHEFIFGAMDVAGLRLTATCSAIGVNPFTAARYATAGWTYRGKQYSAAYWVDASGAVSPANVTAGELDRAASSGVNALLSLLR